MHVRDKAHSASPKDCDDADIGKLERAVEQGSGEIAVSEVARAALPIGGGARAAGLDVARSDESDGSEVECRGSQSSR